MSNEGNNNLYPRLPPGEEEDVEEEIDHPTDRIRLSKLPRNATEDGIKLFFNNRKRHGFGGVVDVDYDQNENIAVIIFKDSDAVERVMSKKPLVFNDKIIEAEKIFVEDEEEREQFNRCTIEVTGMATNTDENTLMLYFESENATGDENDVLSMEYVEEDGMYLVRFTEEKIVDAVLKRQHRLEGADLHVRKHIPSEPDAKYPKQVFVGGFSTKTTEEALINFLEAKSKHEVDKLIYGDLEGTAIAVFKDQPDIEKLKAECKKRMLEGHYLKIDAVPVSKCIIVSNIKKNVTKDSVMFYFDNEKKSGVTGVEEVELSQESSSAIVSFVDCEAPVTACKRQHIIEGSEVKVEIYHECLGGTASGDGPKFKPLNPITIALDKPKAHFLSFSKTCQGEIDKSLNECHAVVQTWPAAKNYKITIKCNLTADTKDCKKLAQTWEADVQTCLNKTLEKINVKSIKTLQDAWKPVINEVSSVNISEPDLVGLSVEASSYELYVVGYNKQVSQLYGQIRKIVDDTMKAIEKKKQELKENCQLKSHQINFLVSKEFEKQILKAFKGLKVKIDVEKNEVVFDGLSKDVIEAKLKMYNILEGLFKVSGQTLSNYQQKYLQKETVWNKVQTEFKNKKLFGIWDIKDNSLIIYSTSESDGCKCIEILMKFINEACIDLKERSNSVLSTDAWKNEVEKLIKKYAVFDLEIITESSQSKIVFLCTEAKKFGNVREDIETFLSQNVIQKQTVKLSKPQMQIIQLKLKEKVIKIENDLEKFKVKVTIESSCIKVEGTVEGIKIAKEKIDTIIGEIKQVEHKINKPGISKFMATEGKKKIESTEKEVGVVIVTHDVDGHRRQNQDERRENLAPQKINVGGITEVALGKLSGGSNVEVAAVLGDITQLSVDVIVNAANEDLDHKGGLAKAIVSKGGKSIQDECTQHVNKNGKLSEGDVFCSKPEKLKCKMICHAVGPTWKGGKNNEEMSLYNCIIASLEQIESHTYSSVAIPAVSTSIFGYPVAKATKTIAEAVNDYFNDHPNSKIRKTYFCDIVEGTVKCFVDGMKKYFKVRQLINPDEMAQRWRRERTENVQEENFPGRNVNPDQNQVLQFGNITVKVVRGQLSQQRVDVIVNTTSHDLQLENGAVSKSLLATGGSTLQTECTQKYPKGIKEGKVAVTSGGNLACKNVYHGCLPSWNKDQSSIKVLEAFVTECLDTASKNRHQSVAFPSLGTGNLGYPVDQVAKYMFACVEKFSSSDPRTSVKEVVFVVYDLDRKSVQAFEAEYRKRLGVTERPTERFAGQGQHRPRTGIGRPSSARPGTGRGRKPTVKLGKLDVKIYQGDITAATVDVVVYSSNTDCDLRKGAVAQTILKKGGKNIITEINQQKEKMKKEGLVVTTGGNLPCDKLIHLDMQDTSKDLKTKIFQVLKQTDDLQKHTMAIPALGTANANMDINKVAQDMLGVITHYEPRTLQEVHIVIYQQSMLNAFKDATEKCHKKLDREPSMFLETPSREMGFGRNNRTRLQRELTKIDMAEVKISSEFKVTIYAKDKSDCDKAVKMIDKDIEACIKQKEIKAEKVIKEFNKGQLDQLKQIEATKGVEIKADTKAGKLILKGFMCNMGPALDKANDIIKYAEDNRLAGLKANVMKDSVQWYIIQKKGDKEELVEYPSYVNMLLETGYQNMKSNVEFSDTKGNQYFVEFVDMVEKSANDLNDRVPVVRKSKLAGEAFKPPDSWDDMAEGVNFMAIVLKTDSREYKDVVKQFHSSVGSSRPIIEVQRIQNKSLYQQYVAKKKSIDSTNKPGHQNERLLWHGFAVDAMESINKFGFNRSYCGKNATAYGDGVYFAVQAGYSSSNTYSQPDSNGHKRMYLSQVLTGEYTTGGYGMRLPPAKKLPDGSESHILYDSVVNDTSSPAMFIIFHDAQAYPQYMIVFT